jgi:hypothetical protein
MPASISQADVISVTIELCERAMAHTARVLRESGGMPARLKVGTEFALAKPKQQSRMTWT